MLGILVHIDPKQVDVARVPIVALKPSSAQHMRLGNPEHTLRANFGGDGSRLRKPERGANDAQMCIAMRTPRLGGPGHRIHAQHRSRMACRGLGCDPRGEVPLAIRHPGAQATGVLGRAAKCQRVEFVRVHVHAREVGCNQLGLEGRPVEKLLKKGSAVKRALAVSRQEDGTPFVPMLEIVKERRSDVAVGYFRSRPTERISKVKNSDVGLPIAGSKDSANACKG